MTGALNLSLRPLSSAMQSMAVKREGFISRYFRPNNGTGDSGDLLTPIVIPAGADFKIQSWVSVDNFDTFYQIFSGDRTTFNTQASTGLLTLFLPILSGGSVSRSTTGVIDLNKLNNVVVRVTGGDLFISINGVEEEMVALPALDDFIISRFCGRTNIGSSSQYVGIMPPTMVWINDVLTDWYKFDDPNSVYQRNHAVAQGVELVGTGNEWLIPGSYTGELTYTDDSVSVINADNEIGTRASKVLDNLVVGQTYLVKTKHVGVDTYNVYIREGDVAGVGAIVYSSTTQFAGNYLEFVFSATQESMNILYSRGGSSGDIYAENISIKAFHGCEIVGGMPEDWFKVERQPHWDYWLGVQNLFGPTSDGAVSWTYDGNGTYTKDSDTWGQLGENFGNVSVPGTYQVGFNYSGSGLRLYTQNPAGGNQFLAVPNAGRVLWDYAVPKAGLWFDSNVAIGAEISNISFRRKLEIAE